MLIEIRPKSQITIPAQIMEKLGAEVGDKLEMLVFNGMLVLVPVVVYPKKELDKLKKISEEVEKDKENMTIYSNTEDMVKALGFTLDEL